MTKTYFVTGTDTEVGKTVASCALLQAANAQRFNTVGYKPVASGSEQTPEGLRNNDALLLQANCHIHQSIPLFLKPRLHRISSVKKRESLLIFRLLIKGC